MKPMLQTALKQDQWENLPPALKQHYQLELGQKALLRGKMDRVWHSNIAKIFILATRIANALVPYRGKNVPTTVTNSVNRNGDMLWVRELQFPDKPTVLFPSKMQHIRHNQVIEYTKFGLGIKLYVDYGHDQILRYKLGHYVWSIGPISIRFPNWLVLGGGYIHEWAVGDDEIAMEFKMKHPLYGETFAYSGSFKIK